MAEVLIWLAIGGTIGWFLRRRSERQELAKACTDLLAAQWAEHVEMHADAQKDSLVMTAPEAMPIAPAELDPLAVARAMRKFEQRHGH